MPEFRDALLQKAEDAEKGALNLNKTREEVEEVLKKVDDTLQEVEDQLSLNLPGAYALLFGRLLMFRCMCFLPPFSRNIDSLAYTFFSVKSECNKWREVRWEWKENFIQ